MYKETIYGGFTLIKEEGINLAATDFDGTLFFEENVTDDKKAEIAAFLEEEAKK